MKTDQFNNILDNRLLKIREVLSNKAKEYANDVNDDRLHNFHEAAKINDETPEKALWGMFMKHFICIKDMVNNTDKITKELMEEKLLDGINYMILLEAVMTERLDNKNL